MNERLALPFTQYFYFRKQTPAMLDWKRKVKERQTAARDIGKYNPYSEEGWNDELLVGAKESEPEHQAEALLQDSLIFPMQKDGEEAAMEAQRKALVKPMPRVTEADRKNDQRSLNRSLQRTLYLLVQNDRGHWTFPTDAITGRESLHQVCHSRQPVLPLQLSRNPLEVPQHEIDLDKILAMFKIKLGGYVVPSISGRKYYTYSGRSKLTACSGGEDLSAKLIIVTTGSSAHSCPIRRSKHEYLDRRKFTCWIFPIQLPETEKDCQRGGYHGTRREDILHERQDNGWPGQS